MRKIYQWQQRWALTRYETLTLSTIALLLLSGVMIRTFSGGHVPAPAPEILPLNGALTVADGTAKPAVPVPPPKDYDRKVSKKAKPVPVNINRASADQLESLPGVGPKLAQAIIAFREEHGPFEQPEDLKLVKGIGDVKYRKMEPYLRIQ